jgi:hypothetical protein
VWLSILILAISSLVILFLFNFTYKKIYKRIRMRGTIHEY